MKGNGQLIEHEGPAPVPVPAGTEPRALAHVAANPLDLPAEVFRAGLDRRRENRAALMEWVRAALVEGVDFGRIPTRRGPSKPSLWKPGAEKICGMLGVTVCFPTLRDYEQAVLNGVTLVHIIIRCEIRDASGRVVADGVGARSLKQDAGDINKSLKMAEKSAHIDATLRMAGLSEVFTQDLEDMANGKDLETETENAGSDRAPEPTGGEGRGPGNAAGISEAQRRRLEARITELGLDRERVKAWLVKASKGRVQHFADLTQDIYNLLDAKLDEWAEREAIQQEGGA